MSLTKKKLQSEILPAVETLMRSAGAVMLEADHIREGVTAKEGRQNYVTEYDKKVQDLLQKGLAKILPKALFLGEESDVETDISSGLSWIVDPIDGTTNFIKGLNMSAVSVALALDAVPQLGAVYNPFTDEFFSAVKGAGAWLNGSPIHVSDNDLTDGVVLVGTAPYHEELANASFGMMRHYFEMCIDIRRFGSAALDLCFVACGRAELYLEQLVSPWDCAAGALILQEAGGIVTDLKKKPIQFLKPTSIKAGNPKAHKR